MARGLFLDDDIARLKQGRYSGEEAELRRELSLRDFKLRLPTLRAGVGPSIHSWLGVPALRSSRASKGGARPFHLHHSTVSKAESSRSVARKDRIYFAISRGQVPAAREAAGKSLKWQRSAKCWYVPAGSAASLRLVTRYTLAPPPDRAPSQSSKPLGTAAAHQRYIERESAQARGEDGGAVYSLGTIGEDTAERAAFWNAVEGRERADGLVQCRVVAELPHELGRESQRAVMDEFMETFADRGLPAHGVIHRPDAERGLAGQAGAFHPASERRRGGGDPRNVHVHVVYHDRPCERRGPGEWEFAPRKDREARGPSWIRALRERWAAACNAALEREGRETRFHPGSYEDLGIEKLPQSHLGPVLSAFERQGRATDRGTVNLICERDWERRQALAEGVELAEQSVSWLRRLTELEAPAGEGEAAARRLFEGRVGELDRRSAAFDADAVVAGRDRAGRRERAEAMWAHATRQAARGGEHAETWRRIAEAAGESVVEQGGRRAGAHSLSEYAAREAAAGGDGAGHWRHVADVTSAAALEEKLAHPESEPARPSDGRTARRLDAACRAGERRLGAARLLDRRRRIAGEIGRPAAAEQGPPLPTLDKTAARHLDRLVAARAGQRRAGEAAAEIAALGEAASPFDVEVRQELELNREELRDREARHRADLREALAPSLGEHVPAAVDALIAAREKEAAARAAYSNSEWAAAAAPRPVPLPTLDEVTARHLDRLIAARAGQRRADEAAAEIAALGEAASPFDVEVREELELSREELRDREARHREDLREALAPSLGEHAPAAVEALLAAREKERAESAAGATATAAAAAPATMPAQPLESPRQLERRRRRELRGHLSPLFGEAAARRTIDAMVSGAEGGGEAVAVARGADGALTLFPPRPTGPEGPLVTGAQRALRSLLAARAQQGRAREAADEIAVKGPEKSRRDEEIWQELQLGEEELRRREAERRDELVRHLAPAFGCDAEETAAALIECAALGAGALVLRRPEGGVATKAPAGGKAFDAPAAADCFRLLLSARQAVREDGDAGTGRGERERGRALRRELRELDTRIAETPVALRMARREGLEAEIAENVRRARRPRRSRGRDEGR